MERILAIGRKEFIHILRDPRLIIAVLGMPILQLFLFAYALSFDVKNIQTAVLDQDRTSISRSYVSTFEQSGFFMVTTRLPSMRQVDMAFESGRVRAAIIIPPGFADRLVAGESPETAVLIDGSEPNAAQLGQAYAAALDRVFSGRVRIRYAETAGFDPSQAGSVEPHVRVWYNPEGRSANYLVPGLIVVLIMIVTVQQTATTLVKEKDQGTLEQLIASPVRRYELMLGKVLPWVLLAVLDVIAITLAGIFVFGIPFRGDVLTYAVASALFVLCCLALGLLISARASSVEVANQTGLIISFLPGFMLSGFVFPLASIPTVLQWVSYLFPARYFVVVTRSVFLKGAGFPVLWPQIASLAVYALVSLTLASVLYSRRL